MNLQPKGLFALKKNNEEVNEVQIIESVTEIKMKDWGWERAKALDGSNPGLCVCIRNIYENHKEYLRRNIEEQEKAKIPFKNKLHDLCAEKEIITSKIESIRKDRIPFLKNKIEELQNEIRNIIKNPEQYLGDKVSKASFYIGAIILAFLTIYLFIFYSSASYSAFFKEFTLNELGVANSIFDPQALSKGLKDGFTELVLILTIPFVFIGLGYLIHKFQEGKGWKKVPKIAMLIFVTFIFDCILAYEITEKIYNIKASNSFQVMPEYTLNFAFQSVSFWLIIFAGFVVYVIWGFVFDFFMEAYGKLDKISVLIKSKNEEISETQKEITKLETEANEFSNKLSNIEKEINKIKTILDHSEIIKPRELESSLFQFLDGWIEWLNSDRRSHEEQENARQVVEIFIAENIKSLHLENNN
jgi:hypothetical protein